MSTLFTAPGHGFSADDPIVFGNCYPDPAGIVEGQTYYVLATDLTADDFRCAETVGGAAISLTAELDEFVVQAAFSDYVPVTDPTDVHAPPETLATPDAPVIDSALEGGIVRLEVAIP